jgi:hypothetical protein
LDDTHESQLDVDDNRIEFPATFVWQIHYRPVAV